MFPPIRQRLVVVVAVVVGALVWTLSAQGLRAADGSAGLTLIDSRAGVVQTVLLFAMAGIPALIGGLITSATGTVVSGLFVVGASLGVLSAAGGGLEHWLRGPMPPLTTRFIALAFEMVLWGVGIGAVMVLFVRLRTVVRDWIIPGDDPASTEPAPRSIPPAVVASQGQAMAAGGVAALVAGILAFLLIRSADTGQVFWSLLVAFLVGGLAGRIAVPGCSPWGIIVSPALVGVVGYLWVLMRYGNDREAYLAALFSAEQSLAALPGISLPLPIHYASAGVVGVTLGIGWARHFAATTQRQRSG